ncbi:MAG: 16S rRNA (guanine(527)-N(7))-methyltransferase RsmG [Lachnospiraceae bacterium]|nr:16S rRNA (guanine(527)-N(7))-methyltransferase RsmG [Lachnospiraceae bacterium]
MEQFIKDLQEWNIEVSDEQLGMFEKYTGLLLDWNEKINLTAITDINDIYKKHYLDSASLINCKIPLSNGVLLSDLLIKDINICRNENESDHLTDADNSCTSNIIDMSNKTDISNSEINSSILNDAHPISVLDLGSGAGFPGIPLKILFPSLNITLADSLNKRIGFLNLVIDELGLKGIKAVHTRAEEIAHDKEYREQYDLVVSRAVANLSVLSEYCIPFVKEGGYFISYKSGNSSDEISSAKNAIGMLGGKYIGCFDFNLPNSDYSRSNICIKKIKNTEDRFPRKSGTPSKKPL